MALRVLGKPATAAEEGKESGEDDPQADRVRFNPHSLRRVYVFLALSCAFFVLALTAGPAKFAASWSGTMSEHQLATADAGRRSIRQIFQEAETDKESLHGYHRYYRRHLAPYRDLDGVRIMEIGADSGKSLGAWWQYFTNPAAIHGVAYRVDPAAAGRRACGSKMLRMFSRRCGQVLKIFSLDQGDPVALADLKRQNPEGWDIIIDDGSHYPPHQIISFQSLWPKIRAGGMYVIEDVESAWVDDGSPIYGYSIKNGGIGKPPPGNSVEKFKQLVDVVSRNHFGQPELTAFRGVDHDVAEISFADGIIFIWKKPLDSTLEGDKWDQYAGRNWVKRRHSQKSVKQWVESGAPLLGTFDLHNESFGINKP